MKIWAIGDLHLSGDPPTKPMDKFGEHWHHHREQVFANWRTAVAEDDLVLVCGDFSWAISLPEALPDLQAVAALPGRKVLLRGNHDYWWSSLKKMQQALGDAYFFLQNNCYPLGAAGAVCGTRGWLLPDVEGFSDADKPILEREVLRLELSLKAATQAGRRPEIVLLHYPPFYRPEETSPFRELLEKYQVPLCAFGHIHGAEAWQNVFQGELNGTTYRLVSCDSHQFKPVLLEMVEM